MDKRRFVEFLNAVRKDARAFYHYEISKPFKDIIDIITEDVKQFRYFTFDGRFQDLVIKLSKDKKYDILGYQYFLIDLENELKKFVVSNVILLPLNLLDSQVIKDNIIFNENLRLFLPTSEDLKLYTSSQLLNKQEKRKKRRFDEPICKYVDSVLNGHLDKEHILLAKDRAFFRYPILTIHVEDIDVCVVNEAKFITEAVYAFLRMIDYKYSKTDYGRGVWQEARFHIAHTYTVYYNVNEDYAGELYHGGYSYGFNFAEFLDINTSCFLNNKDLFCKVTDTFIKGRFIDKRKLTVKELDIVNKWCNSIHLYNKAYELASEEQYDTCVLTLCALLEALFIKNKGRNKSELLINEITEYLSDIYSTHETENIIQVIKTVYKYRNKIIHEGIGLEDQFIRSRSIYENQGDYRGMKPFHYIGSFYLDKDLYGIKTILECLVDILIGNKMIKQITNIIEKAN